MRNMETKSRVRKEILKLRNELDEKEALNRSISICNRIIESSYYQEMDDIFVYAALGKEVDLSEFIQKAWKDGKHLFFPKVFGEDMEFYRVFGFDQLEEGCFHVLEPQEGLEQFSLQASSRCTKILVLTPGVAFSESGARIGYGKGFYDRYFKRMENADCNFIPVGIAYRFQITNEFEAEAFDYKIKTIFTEKEEVRCNV